MNKYDSGTHNVKLKWWSRKQECRKRIKVMPYKAYKATIDDNEGLGKYKLFLFRLTLKSYMKKGCRIV